MTVSNLPPEYSKLSRLPTDESMLIASLNKAMFEKLQANRHKGGWQECEVAVPLYSGRQTRSGCPLSLAPQPRKK